MVFEEESEELDATAAVAEVGNPSADEDSQAYIPMEHNVALYQEIERVPVKDQDIEQLPVKDQENQVCPMKPEESFVELNVEDKIQQETPPLEEDLPIADGDGSHDDSDDEFAAESQVEEPTSPIAIQRSRPDLFFYGVTIKVNGYTEPDNETLKRMVR